MFRNHDFREMALINLGRLSSLLGKRNTRDFLLSGSNLVVQFSANRYKRSEDIAILNLKKFKAQSPNTRVFANHDQNKLASSDR